MMDSMEAVASVETVETIDISGPTEPIVSIEIISPEDYIEPKKSTRIFKQKYTTRWEKIEEFKDWLLPVENAPHKAFCSACKMQLASKVSILKSHNKSEKHRKILKAVKSRSNRLNDNFILNNFTNITFKVVIWKRWESKSKSKEPNSFGQNV